MDYQENYGAEPSGMTPEQRLEHWKRIGEANARSYGARDAAADTPEQRLELRRRVGEASARKYGVRGHRLQRVAV
jgi:hypothetical protein